MSSSRRRYLLLCASAISALLLATGFVASGRPPGVDRSTSTAKVVKSKPLTEESRVSTRAARIKALEDANDASWSAFTAARHEPKKVLKDIPLSASERRATRFIGKGYLDRFEILDRDDKNARGAQYTSTLLRDIAVLRLQQRADLRRALPRSKQVKFDTNVMALVATRGGG